MNKLFRILSTLLIAVGIGFIYCYVFREQAGRGIEIFDRPSYYVRQNYLYVFFAGSAVVLSALLGSFFSWHKKAESKEEILPNAGFSGKEEVDTWLKGSTLDTEAGKTVEGAKALSGNPVSKESDKTEILDKEEKTLLLNAEEETEVIGAEEKTEILAGSEGKTEILSESGEKTEALPELEEKTEILAESEEKTEILTGTEGKTEALNGIEREEGKV